MKRLKVTIALGIVASTAVVAFLATTRGTAGQQAPVHGEFQNAEEIGDSPRTGRRCARRME